MWCTMEFILISVAEKGKKKTKKQTLILKFLNARISSVQTKEENSVWIHLQTAVRMRLKHKN